MKRKTALILVALLLIFSVGCGSSEQETREIAPAAPTQQAQPEKTPESTEQPEATPTPTPELVVIEPTEATDATATRAIEITYVLNLNTMKFHKPKCSSVKDITENNRKDVTMSREEIISQGFEPCKRCNP